MVALVLVVRPLAIFADVSIRHNALDPGRDEPHPLAEPLACRASELAVLPKRLCRPYRESRHANGELVARERDVEHPCGLVHRRLWRDGVRVAHRRRLAARDSDLHVVRQLRADPSALRAEAPRARARELRRALARHGPRRRQLHEHSDGEALRPHARRGRVRPRSDGWALRRHAFASGDDHAVPHLLDGAERAAARQHRGDRSDAVGARRRRRGSRRDRVAARVANGDGSGLGELGGHVDLREHRHRARGHAIDRRAASRRGSSRRACPRSHTGRDPVREPDVRLRARRRAARGAEPESHDPPGRACRARRPFRRRQIHAREPLAAAARHRVGPDLDRRPGYCARHAGDPASRDRHGDAGHVVVASLDRGQHPLRQAECERSRGRGSRTQSAGARVHRRAARLARPARRIRPTSASAA